MKNPNYYHVDCGFFPTQIKLCFSNKDYQDILKDYGVEVKATALDVGIAETHLIPNIKKATKERPISIFGSDWPTPDGTCIRDYVHVTDVAEAHINAAKYLLEGNESITMNLGTGRGHSILEMIQTLESVTGKKVIYTVNPRRSGDADSLVADTTIAKKVLTYSPKYDIVDILKTAYDWHKNGNQT